MSSGVIFVPGAFGITLKRPKRRTLQSPMRACGVMNCKQLYDPDIPINKLFYAASSCGKQPRRDYCPMHASMAMDDKEKEPKAQKSRLSSSSISATSVSSSRMSACSFSSSSFSSPSIYARAISTSASAKSSENEPGKDGEGAWRETPVKTTFGFGNIEEEQEA